ncbi:hypothetical protein P9279_22230 [Mesorhizobium sp. WSM4962]|uniref:hypothetical protein n=1 Tax=Mesorhizobium sp. WSM4962 TaxID=3038548 RepID=UPI002416C044|nr:hypothetical protein [Mesorhizobium sp. WSM4962]MDG4903232.1 hypothetical protein [Mesorhizobium sp. WSM4962]
MTFRLPDITYPLSIDTIGKMLALGHEMTVNCLNTGCGQSSRVNLVALGHRIGFEHPCLAQDLQRYFYCPKCRAADRDDKHVGFIHLTLSNPHSLWPRDQEKWRQQVGRRAG